MSCEFEYDDGAYVLGALSPADRQAFEAHLSGCDRCQRSVRELAGLPGLLARVDAGVLESPAADVPVPAGVLPTLLRDVRTERRRRTWLTAGAAAAAAVVVATATFTLAGINDSGGGPSAAPSATSSSTATVIGRLIRLTNHCRSRLIRRMAKGVRRPRRTRNQVSTAETSVTTTKTASASSTSCPTLRLFNQSTTTPSCR